ncbi:MAG: diaminopimelate decarboxylase [Candidatus Kapabacteria bacterium]|nr:diaminopimelate decarboxylase [Ignavibacteriota bacterium]MCW5884522.1 diaminopimelate decarboxylase [Candidatus Kapabacteria bacterium]
MEKIGNFDIKELALDYGTPLYVYDKNIIQDNYNKLLSSFKKYYEKTKVHFSVKANSNINVLQVFNDIGCGADCSSPFELLLAKRTGFPDERILYTGNYESLSDFSYMTDYNIKVNLDDVTSFDRMIKMYKPEIISFRINPGIGKGGYEGITTGGTDAKFGVPYEKAYHAYQNAKDKGFTRFGIHMMTGSNNLEPYYFAQVVEKLMMIAAGIFEKLGTVPEYVDIGGGFGIPYEDDDQSLDIELTAKLVTEIFIEKCEKYGFGQPELLMEPGRYLIGNAGWLISKVTGIKHSYKHFVGVDAGMSTLIRPALYGAKHRTYVYGKDIPEWNVNLCGQICENSDIFAKNIFLPAVEEGDYVIIRDTGAYGFVMSSNYNNRPRPAEIMVSGSKVELIRRRETFDDMIRYYEI